MVTGPLGPAGSVVVFALVVVVAFAAIRPFMARQLAAAGYLGVGGLHFLNDGFIWRSPSSNAAPRADTAVIG